MEIIEQVTVKPNFNIKADITKGSSIKLIVSEPFESNYKIEFIQFNLLKIDKDKLSLELVVGEDDFLGDTISIVENLENSKANYDKLKITLERFKLIFNKIQPIIGNHLVISCKVDNKKLDLKKKTIQIYNYNTETKLPEGVFECEVKVNKKRIDELQKMLQLVLEQDIVDYVG